MHIARQTPQELVVVAGTRWISAICAAAALFIFSLVIRRHEPKGLLLAGFFLLFALIMDQRKTFAFDSMQRIVRWKGRKVFKAESGTISFDDIVDIGTETTRAGRADTTVYRLMIVTSRTAIPMAYTYNGQPDRYSALREQILEFIRPRSTMQSIEVGRSAAVRK
jgi:hypothetical protein